MDQPKDHLKIELTYDEKNETIKEASISVSGGVLTLPANNIFEISLTNKEPKNSIPNFQKLLLILEFFETAEKSDPKNSEERMPTGTNSFTGLGDYITFSFSRSKQGIISKRLVPSWSIEGMDNPKTWAVNLWIADFTYRENNENRNLIYVKNKPQHGFGVPTFTIKV